MSFLLSIIWDHDFPQIEADLGRRALISSAFRALNRSGTGHLSASEMRPFAELTGASVGPEMDLGGCDLALLVDDSLGDFLKFLLPFIYWGLFHDFI